MVAWDEEYRSKVVSTRKAVSHVKKGKRLFMGTGCAEPQMLIKALVELAHSLADNEIISTYSFGLAPTAERMFGDNFRLNAFVIGDSVRNAVNEGRADYTPINLSDISRLLEKGRMDIDIAMIQVSPPDRHGYCSLGVSVDITKAAAKAARMIIAEVNPQMPRTNGDGFMHVSEIDLFVEVDYPLYEWRPDRCDDEVLDRIGRQVSGIIKDGSTIQIGFGDIPDAVLRHLKSKRDLGVHTEMFSDGLIDLIARGVVNGEKKSINEGKVVAAFCMGTKRLFDFVDDNPIIEFHPSSYVNDPCVIARNSRMVSINSALQVDLTGQVCADQIGYTFYSGVAGQAAFHQGACRSWDGRPIIAMPSTARDGTVSRITAKIPEGAGVTTTRNDVHYIVTEYGAVNLHGKSVMQRAMALISIAHPDFREELLAAAKFHGYVYQDQSTVGYLSKYPEEYEEYHEFMGGTLFIRPVKPSDEEMVKELFYSFSEDTVYHRFMTMKQGMPHRERMHYVSIDYEKEMHIAAISHDGEVEEIIAMAGFQKAPGNSSAEVAFMVRDDWQDKGIGSHMFTRLIRIGSRMGMTEFTAEVLSDNVRMLNMFYRTGLKVEAKLIDGVYSVRMSLRERANEKGRHVLIT